VDQSVEQFGVTYQAGSLISERESERVCGQLRGEKLVEKTVNSPAITSTHRFLVRRVNLLIVKVYLAIQNFLVVKDRHHRQILCLSPL
jgi:hypothetical protein